ncbi:Zinc finger protein 64-like 3 [Homarus americanus]|uniref:Zinc finger protein 64-like 3 n=1 Tax=Homarus americanus TaxID=6706 RepID=A0A8J5MJM6_HOMAM|nr:Zinc finger protein 64-like 3 [Homarus americanus]
MKGIPCAAYGHSTSNITDERQRSMNKAGSSSILQLGRENKAEKGIVQRCEGEAHASNNNVVTQETEMNVRNDIMIRHEMDMKARNNRNILRQREAKASIGMLKKLEERRTKPKIILLQKLKCGSLSPINIANEQGRKFVFKIDGDKGPKEKTKARQGTIVRQKWDDEVGRNAASHQGETQGGHDALLRLQVNAETRDLSPLKQEEIGVSMLSSKEVVPGRLKTVANSCVTKKMKGLQSQKVVHSAHKSCWCSCKEQNPKSSLEDKSAVLDFTTYGTKDGIIPNNIAHSKPSYKNLKEQIKYVAEPPRDVETHSGDAEKDFIVEEWKDKVPENCRVEIHMEMNSQHECNSHKEKQVQVKIVGTDKECKNFTVMKKNNNEFRDKCKENAQVKARHYKTGNGNRDSQTGKVQTLTRFCEKELQENKRCSHLIDEVDGAVRIKDIGKYEQFEKNGLKGQPVKDFTTNDSLLKDIDIKCPSGEDIVVKYSPPKDSGMKETSNKDNNIRDLRIEVNSSSTGSNCASAIVDTDNGVNCLPGKDLPIRDSDGKDPSLDIKEPDTSVEGDGIKDQPVEDDGKTSLVDESVNYRPFGNSDLKDLQYEDRGLNHTLLTDDSTKHLPVDESNKKHLSVKGSYLKTPPVDSFQKKYLPDNELGQNISQNRNGMKDLLVKNLVSTTICAENNDLMKTQQKKHPTKVCEAGRVTTKEEVLMVRGKDKCQDDPIVENPGIGCDGHVEERDSAEGQSELQKTLIDDKGKHGERNMQINVGKGKVEGTDIGKTQMEDGNDQVNGYQEQMQMDKLHGENGRQVEGGMMKGELKNAGNKKTADKSGNIRLINTSNESHIEVRNCQWENNNGKRKDEFGSRGVMLSLDNDNVERSYRYKLHSAKILPGHHNIVTNTKDIGNIVPQEQIGLAERTASLENGKNYSINTNGTSSQIPNKSYSHDPISIGKSSKIYHFKSKSRPRVPGGNTSRRETWKDSLMMNHEKKKKSGPVVEINRSEEVHHLSTRTQKSLKKSNEGFLKRKGKKSIRVKKTVYVKHENVDMAGDTCCHTHDVQFSDSTITSRIECIKKSGEYIQISSPRGSGEDSRRVTEESFIMDEEMLPDVTWGKFEDEIEFIVVGDTTNTGGMNGTHGYLLSSKMSAALGVESIVKSEEFFATPESPGSPVNLSNEQSVRCENHSNRSQAVSCRQEGEKCPEKVISDTQELHSLKRNCAEEAPRGNNLESSDLSIKSLSNSLSITSHKQGTKESNRHEVISHERETVNESWSLVINHEGDGPGSTGAKFTVELGAISVNNREYSLISPQQDQRTSQEVMKFDVLNKSISLQDTEQSCNIETQQVNDEGVQCIICSDMFVTINEMVSHFRDAHIENRFFMVCPALNCSARIANNKMNSHIRNHVIIQKHKCPHCSFSTSARASLGRHLTIHKQQKLLFHNEVQEGDCDTHHLGRALSSELQDSSRVKTVSYLCDNFEEETPTDKDHCGDTDCLLTYKESSAKCQNHEGQLCVNQETQLCVRGVDTNHVVSDESFHSGSETKPVHCCSRTWSTVKDLQDHFRECHMRDIQNVPCLDSACPVKLWGSNMDSHLRCHILQGEYKCQLCTYSSNKATALRVHGYAHNKSFQKYKFGKRESQSLTDGQVTDTTKSRKIKSKLNIVAPSGCKRKYFFKKSKLAKKSYSESNKPVKNVCRGENKDFGRIEEIRNICTIDKSNSSQTIPETSSQPPCKDGKILTEDVDAQQAPQLDGKSNNLGNYSCPLCVDCYETPDKLVYHYISSHPYHSPYTCTFEGCPVVLQKRDSSRHLIGHIYEKAFKCPLCSYSHQNLHMLKNHLFCHSQVLEKLQLKEIVDLQIKGPSGDVSVYLNGETVRKRLKRKLNSSIDDQRPTKLQKVDDSLSAEGTQDIEEQGVLQAKEEEVYKTKQP